MGLPRLCVRGVRACGYAGDGHVFLRVRGSDATHAPMENRCSHRCRCRCLHVCVHGLCMCTCVVCTHPLGPARPYLLPAAMVKLVFSSSSLPLARTVRLCT